MSSFYGNGGGTIDLENLTVDWDNVLNKPSIQGNGDDVSVTGKLIVGAAPTSNMDVATKQYVDTKLATKQNTLTFDNTPIANSTNPVRSGGLKTIIDNIQNEITNIAAVAATPLTASTAAAMTDTDKIYVYIGDEVGYTFGNWYYYDGTAWLNGGVYNAIAFETDKTLSVENMAADAKAVNRALSTKAPNLVSGSAEQLLSDVGTEDKAPYLFRAVPYDSTRVDEEVVGVSVGWNQLIRGGNFEDATYWSTNNTVTISNGVITVASNPQLRQSVPIEAGHKYLFFMDIKPGQNTTNTRVDVGTGSIVSEPLTGGTWHSFAKLFTRVSASSSNNIFFSPDYNYASAGDTYEVKNFQLIDLTTWFGSAIADYAYTLEQATAGSGVAFIKALLPGGYIPYSAPKMESVSGLSGHKFVGFNQWDEQWELGYYSISTGNPTSSSAQIRSKNRITVLPNTNYNFSSDTGFTVLWYDADDNFIDYSSPNTSNTVRKSFANARYLRFYMPTGYGTTYKHNICINLSDPAKNGTYEPYKATTYALDSDLTLRGILKMDSDHNVYADGDVYGADGTVTHRYGIVDLGTLTWTYANDVFKCEQLTGHKITEGVNIICSKYIAIDATYTVQYMTDKTIKTNNAQATWFYVKDSAYSDAATFKDAMSGVYLIYELTTPTTETADLYASPQNCAVGGTEEYVYAEGGSGVPVGHNSKYQKNMRSELERVMVAVPDAPGQNGTYSLKATVTSSGVTYAWVSD